jgi:hypothetical protein
MARTAPCYLFLRGWRECDHGRSLLSALNVAVSRLRLCAAALPFVKALSKIVRAGQAPSVTIPRTPWRVDPLVCLRNVRNRVFRQL